MQEQAIQHNIARDVVVYQPLIEELDIWQGIFELALEEAAKHIDPQQQFPAQDLQESLTEMCELIRTVLLNSIPRSDV